MRLAPVSRKFGVIAFTVFILNLCVASLVPEALAGNSPKSAPQGATAFNTAATQISNFQADLANWSVPYCEVASTSVDCASPSAPLYYAPSLTSYPALSGKALQTGLLPASSYSSPPPQYPNVMYRYLLNNSSALQANNFKLDLDFYYTPPTSFNNAGGTASQVQAVEFAFIKWQGTTHWDWEIQWANVLNTPGTPPVWRMWGGSQGWVSTGITAQPQPEQWHHLTLSGKVRGGQVYYNSFALDSANYTLNRSFAPQSIGGSVVTVHVQLDGPAQIANGYKVFIDNANLTWQ